jgi:ubiquinone/menaquinone biosynthesis C-methylase UbiE
MSSVTLEVKLPARQAYELWAPHYDSDPNALTALEERCFSASMSKFREKDIVELGCGTGRWLRRLERFAPRSLTGVDASEGMLIQARRKCANSTRLIHADCLRTSLPDGHADCVLSSFMLSHIHDLKGFATEAARIARHRATILISDLHPDTASYGWRQTFRSASSLVEIETHRYSLRDLTNAMEDAGCSLHEIVEPCFTEEDAEVFQKAGKIDNFRKVASLPVIYRASFTRK